MDKKGDYYKLVTTQVSSSELDSESDNNNTFEQEDEDVYYDNKRLSTGPADVAVSTFQ